MWISFQTQQDVVAAASTAVLTASLNAAALALRPFTVVRTRLDWAVRSDQVAASEIYGLALGFAVVSDQASAIGVTAVPTPFTDQGSDLFFLYEQIFGQIVILSAVGQNEAGQLRQIDSKAMRKVNDDQDVVVVLESNTFEVGQASILGGRMLIKLH